MVEMEEINILGKWQKSKFCGNGRNQYFEEMVEIIILWKWQKSTFWGNGRSRNFGEMVENYYLLNLYNLLKFFVTSNIIIM